MELVCEEYKGQQTNELAALQATAYCHNNPFVKALGFTYQEMYNEFISALTNKLYTVTFMFYDKIEYDQGMRNIIGTASWCDAIVFSPPEGVDYLKVPTKFEVRLYMKYLCTNYIYKKYKPKFGEIAFGTSLAISPNNMQSNLSYKIMIHGLKWAIDHGYKYILGNAINEYSKQIIKKTKWIELYSVDVSDMIVVKDGIQPFKGLNLSQETHLLLGPESIALLTSVVQNREKPRL